MRNQAHRQAQAFATRLAGEHGESLFECLEDIQFWMKDVAGRYMRVNRALLANYGFHDEADILGRTDAELFPPHLAEQYLRDDRAVLAGEQVRDRSELVERPDRSTGWHETNKILLRGQDGRALGTAGITRDLSRGSVAATSSSLLRGVVEHLNAHADQRLDRRRYARMIGRSVRSLERRFAGAFGLSLLHYQRQLRMQRACHLLVSGEESIVSIAMSVGYADHSHFTREFGRLFALSPRAYRRRWSPPRLRSGG